MSDEPNAGGPYQFAEPNNACWVPVRPGSRALIMTLRATAAAWYGDEAFSPRKGDAERVARIIPVVRGWDEQMRAIYDAQPIPAERFAELREAALHMGQEIADEAAGD